MANQEAMLDPYAAITSLNPGELQATSYDASRSRGMSGNPCTSFRWDFSDGSKVETTETTTIEHVFAAPGNYFVECRVSDDAGHRSMARLAQNVSDALKASAIGTPFWSVSAAESRASEVAVFDAPQSREFAGAACSEFVFDFGDGSKPVSSNSAVQTHVMRESGAFEVHVTCVGKHGNKATESLT